MEDSSLIALDLSITSKETLELFMDETADDAIFEEILNANMSRSEVIRLLYEHPNTPDDTRAKASGILSLPVLSADKIEEARERIKTEKMGQPEEVRTQRLVQKIQRLSVSEKIRIALKGNGEVRGVLLRESNKQVILNVLANPRITDKEIESVARNRSILEEALRVIARNKEWTKNYAVQLALVNNPKTPPGLAVGFVDSLKKKDLSLLEKNKNVSEAVRSTAKKFLKGKSAG